MVVQKGVALVFHKPNSGKKDISVPVTDDGFIETPI
jgi:hypothetical protein